MEQRKSISLQDLDDRLGNVENSLRDILENGEASREEFNERLIDIKDEMENLNHSVKKVKQSMSYRPTTVMFVIIIVLVLWTTVLHIY
jgi:type II secretory pathway component PulF